MSSILPRNNAQRAAYLRNRIALWTTNATAIGTTTVAVSALDALVDAVESALASQGVAQDAAKAATETVENAVAAMTNSGMAIVEQVRVKSRSVGDSVYPLANIPTPSTGSPVGPPGTPSDFKAELRPDGAVRFTWKCAQPAGAQGTIYQIYRAIDDGESMYLGGAGRREFIDATIPAGSKRVTYTIQATRSTVVGVSNEFVVKFGVDDSGVTTMSVEPRKIAA